MTRLLAAMVIFAVIALAVAGAHSVYATSQQAAACKAKGGVLIHGDGDFACVKLQRL